MDNAFKERKTRRAVVYFPLQYLETLLSAQMRQPRDMPQYLTIPQVRELPETAKFVGMFQSFERLAIGVIVEDESFAEVECGCCYPELRVEWYIRALALEPMASRDTV